MKIEGLNRRAFCRGLIAAPFVLRRAEAQIMISPSQGLPPAAAAWNFNRLVFSDEFTSLSTIDVNNTKTAGFKWYTNNQFPNSSFSQFQTSPATPAADIGISGSVLTITDDVSHISEGLNTCYWNGSAILGTTFSGGFYAEVRMSFDPTLGAGGVAWNAWPIYWFWPMSELDGSVGTASFTEIDGFEAYPDVPGNATISPIMTTHDWIRNAGAGNHNNQNTNNHIDTYINLLSGFHFYDMHTYGTLWVPSTRNAGQGLFQRYLDNVFINQTHIAATSEVDYTSTGPASPGAAQSNPNGTFFSSEAWSQCLVIGAGHNWPTSFDFVRIWQP
jgi:hypothetical protein